MLLILQCSSDWLSYLKVWSHCIFIFSPEIRGTWHVLCVCTCTAQDLKASSLVYQFTTGTWFIGNIWCLHHEEIVLGLYHFYHRRTLKSVWSLEESILRHSSFLLCAVCFGSVAGVPAVPCFSIKNSIFIWKVFWEKMFLIHRLITVCFLSLGLWVDFFFFFKSQFR